MIQSRHWWKAVKLVVTNILDWGNISGDTSISLKSRIIRTRPNCSKNAYSALPKSYHLQLSSSGEGL